MIVLDTNVLSELLRQAPDPAVVAWLDDQPRASIFTTSVTRGEILYGILLLPDGQRRQALWNAAGKIFDEDLVDHVLSFDSAAADLFAEVAAARRVAGRPISQLDAMIVAMARSRGARLATRNVQDFELCGVEVVNPWSA